MDNLNTGRQSLLLELTRDIIQNTNAGFDDSSIKFKIDKYIELDSKIENMEKELGRKLNHGERAALFREVFGWEFKPGDGYGSTLPPVHSF